MLNLWHQICVHLRNSLCGLFLFCLLVLIFQRVLSVTGHKSSLEPSLPNAVLLKMLRCALWGCKDTLFLLGSLQMQYL